MALPQRIYQVVIPEDDYSWDYEQQRLLLRDKKRRRRQYLVLGFAAFCLAVSCAVSNLAVSHEYYRLNQVQEKMQNLDLLTRQARIAWLNESRLPVLEELAGRRIEMRQPDKIKFVPARPAQAALAAR